MKRPKINVLYFALNETDRDVGLSLLKDITRYFDYLEKRIDELEELEMLYCDRLMEKGETN